MLPQHAATRRHTPPLCPHPLVLKSWCSVTALSLWVSPCGEDTWSVQEDAGV